LSTRPGTNFSAGSKAEAGFGPKIYGIIQLLEEKIQPLQGRSLSNNGISLDSKSQTMVKEKIVPRGFRVRNARRLMSAWLGLGDLVGVLVACTAAIVIWSFINPTLQFITYVDILPLPLLFVAAFWVVGLYPAVGISPVEELRRLTLTTTMVFMALGTLSFYVRNVEVWSRASFGLAWVFSLFILPFIRGLMREIACKRGMWGEPAAIIGYGLQGSQIYRLLSDQPKLGLRPVMIIDGFGSEEPVADIPVRKGEDLLSGKVEEELKDVQTGILVTAEIPAHFLNLVIEEHWSNFKHLVMVSDAQSIGSVWITPYDLGGMLGLEVRQNLLSRWQQHLKSIVDLLIILLFSPIFVVMFAFISAAIWLEDRGSIFYRQTRIGQDGRKISVWKFRTMVQHADEVLDGYFVKHPELREEWELTHKLRNDPRVTRVGWFLRRMSLDELPQIFNVIGGEMSLVGPRPIVDDEIRYYGNRFKLYTQVLPGMTGMWQVSGRNDVSYEERVRLDEYYVRNWSTWLDFYIMAMTILAVLNGKGAY
jgi:Undecaprenyl-phosphate galactose phosphotransferase WbaP